MVRLAEKIRPAPALPDEAIEHVGRGVFMFKHASSKADYVSAAQEYEQAIAAAPWDVNFYSDICTIYEKAKDYVNAKRNCEFALLGETNPQDITSLRERIAGLEAGIEQADRTKAGAAQKEAESQRFLASVEGKRYNCSQPMAYYNDVPSNRIGVSGYYWFVVESGTLRLWMTYTWKDTSNPHFAYAPLGTAIRADTIWGSWPPHLTGPHTRWSDGSADFSGTHLTVALVRTERTNFAGTNLGSKPVFECNLQQ